MKEKTISEFDRSENTRKMEAWAKENPFTAMMLFGDETFEEKVAYAEKKFSN